MHKCITINETIVSISIYSNLVVYEFYRFCVTLSKRNPYKSRTPDIAMKIFHFVILKPVANAAYTRDFTVSYFHAK